MPSATGYTVAVLADCCGDGDPVHRRVGRMYLGARTEDGGSHDRGRHDVPGGHSRMDGVVPSRQPPGTGGRLDGV
jgi:hypothetical protein